MKVHNARTQHVMVVHNGSRKKSLADQMQPIEQFPIERIEMTFNRRVLKLRSEIHRDIAEGGDAQILRHKLKLRVTVYRLGHRFRQADIVSDHFAITRCSGMLQSEPYFQGAETTRVLKSVVNVVRGALLEMIVGRVVCECRA